MNRRLPFPLVYQLDARLLLGATLAGDWPIGYDRGGSGGRAQQMEQLPLRRRLADGGVANRRDKPKFGPEELSAD